MIQSQGKVSAIVCLLACANLAGAASPFIERLEAALPQKVVYTTTAAALTAISGDYNHDGHVNAADYTVWRDTLGSVTPNGFGADGNFNGVIDVAEYNQWKNHVQFPANSAAALAIPEPTACLLALETLLGMLLRLRFWAY
jgi:hypothetical protein